jgi:hypothetical protein
MAGDSCFWAVILSSGPLGSNSVKPSRLTTWEFIVPFENEGEVVSSTGSQNNVIRNNVIGNWTRSLSIDGQTLLVVLGKRELERGAGTLIRRGPQPSTVILNNGAANR